MIIIINKHPPSHRYKKTKVYLLVTGTLWTFNFQIYDYSCVNCSSHVVYYILSIYLPFKFITFNISPSLLPSDNHKSDLLL